MVDAFEPEFVLSINQLLTNKGSVRRRLSKQGSFHESGRPQWPFFPQIFNNLILIFKMYFLINFIRKFHLIVVSVFQSFLCFLI